MQLTIILAYLTLVLMIGVYSTRRVKNSEDFVVAGRSLSQLVLSGTLLATVVGSGIVVGGASFIYQYGPWASIFFLAGIPLTAVVMYFLADNIRRVGSYTVPEIFEIRYGATARAIASFVVLLALVGIVSYQFIGAGYLVNITTGLPVWLGTIVAALVIVFLAFTGGLISVAYTDAIGAALILVALLIALPLVLSQVGGIGGLFESLPETQSSWNGGLTLPQLLGYFLPLFLLLIGDQSFYQRFSAAQNPQTAKKSTVGFFVGVIFTLTPIVLLASAAIILLPEISPDTAILSLAGSQTLPVILGGILLAASAGLIITTGNSYLLSTAGNLVYDLYVWLFGRRIPEGRGLLFNRVAVLIVGILAYLLGQFFPSVLDLQIYAYTIYGAAITPTLIAALLWRRATAAGAIASIFVGAVATIVWQALGLPLGWNSVLIALPISIATMIVVSLLTGGSRSGRLAQEIVKERGRVI